jgi:hypothetical protein
MNTAFSVGASLGHFDIHTIPRLIPKHAWTPGLRRRRPTARGSMGGRGHRAVATLAARLADLDGAARVLNEPVRFSVIPS